MGKPKKKHKKAKQLPLSKEELYADYIDGKRSYMDITLEIRNNR